MTSSNRNFFSVTVHLCGKFTGPRWIPCKKVSDAELWCFFFYLRPNKWLSKQSWGCWFETPSRPVWWHRNGYSNPLNHAQVNNFDNIRWLIKLYFISSHILFLKSIWYFHDTYYLICSKQHIVYNFKVIGSIPWYIVIYAMINKLHCKSKVKICWLSRTKPSAKPRAFYQQWEPHWYFSVTFNQCSLPIIHEILLML